MTSSLIKIGIGNLISPSNIRTAFKQGLNKPNLKLFRDFSNDILINKQKFENAIQNLDDTKINTMATQYYGYLLKNNNSLDQTKIIDEFKKYMNDLKNNQANRTKFVDEWLYETGSAKPPFNRQTAIAKKASKDGKILDKKDIDSLNNNFDEADITTPPDSSFRKDGTQEEIDEFNIPEGEEKVPTATIEEVNIITGEQNTKNVGVTNAPAITGNITSQRIDTGQIDNANIDQVDPDETGQTLADDIKPKNDTQPSELPTSVNKKMQNLDKVLTSQKQKLDNLKSNLESIKNSDPNDTNIEYYNSRIKEIEGNINAIEALNSYKKDLTNFFGETVMVDPKTGKLLVYTKNIDEANAINDNMYKKFVRDHGNKILIATGGLGLFSLGFGLRLLFEKLRESYNEEYTITNIVKFKNGKIELTISPHIERFCGSGTLVVYIRDNLVTPSINDNYKLSGVEYISSNRLVITPSVDVIDYPKQPNASEGYGYVKHLINLADEENCGLGRSPDSGDYFDDNNNVEDETINRDCELHSSIKLSDCSSNNYDRIEILKQPKGTGKKCLDLARNNFGGEWRDSNKINILHRTNNCKKNLTSQNIFNKIKNNKLTFLGIIILLIIFFVLLHYIRKN